MLMKLLLLLLAGVVVGLSLDCYCDHAHFFIPRQKGRGTRGALIFLILISYPFGQISRFYITHK
jgi:hypothetical protein